MLMDSFLEEYSIKEMTCSDLIDPFKQSSIRIAHELHSIMQSGLAKKDGEGILSAAALPQSQKVLVVQDKETGSVCGYCAISENVRRQLDANIGLWQKRQREKSVYIEQIIVVPEHRRKGLATKMISELRKTHSIIYVHVSTKNTRSLLFHLKNGFEVIDWYYAKGFYGFSNYNSLFLRSTTNNAN